MGSASAHLRVKVKDRNYEEVMCRCVWGLALAGWCMPMQRWKGVWSPSHAVQTPRLSQPEEESFIVTLLLSSSLLLLYCRYLLRMDGASGKIGRGGREEGRDAGRDAGREGERNGGRGERGRERGMVGNCMTEDAYVQLSRNGTEGGLDLLQLNMQLNCSVLLLFLLSLLLSLLVYQLSLELEIVAGVDLGKVLVQELAGVIVMSVLAFVLLFCHKENIARRYPRWASTSTMCGKLRPGHVVAGVAFLCHSRPHCAHPPADGRNSSALARAIAHTHAS